MNLRVNLTLAGLVLSLCAAGQAALLAAAQAATGIVPNTEFVTTTPILADGVLYVASFSRPEHAGHLRAIDLVDTPRQLWDAAGRVPAPGTGINPGALTSSDPPQSFAAGNRYRSLFTNLDSMGAEHLQPVTPLHAAQLQTALDMPTTTAAEALINRVRGRLNTSPEQVAGTSDAEHLLWGISRSTPAVAGRSFLAENATTRDQVVYAGAEDGMLHAFHAGQWDLHRNAYDQDGAAAGRELWGYLPGSLLHRLQHQPFDASPGALALHVDGSPAIGDFFLDLNGDGRRQWRTLLVGSASLAAPGRSLMFNLDVTDPYQPRVLWEHLLPGTNPGLTRGAITGTVATARDAPRIFLTAGFADRATRHGLLDPVNGAFGIQALALDLLTGALIWQWQSLYEAPLTTINATPPQPAALDSNGDGTTEYLVFGDLAGRLWAIDATTGAPLGGAPVYTVAGGADQPIGAGVAVHGRMVIFGTGGADHADRMAGYALYAVEILPTGAQLLWTYPLEPGEQVWEAPAIDRFGRIYFATTAADQPADPAAPWPVGGRLVILDKSGQEVSVTATDSPVIGQVRVAPGVAVAVSLTGHVYQFGSARRANSSDMPPTGPLRLFSWRLR